MTTWTVQGLLFGCLLLASLFWQGGAKTLLDARIINTIWLTTILLIPSLTLYSAGVQDAKWRRQSNALYYMAYVAFMFHFYFTVFEHFGGIQQTLNGMRPGVAPTNFLLTGLWSISVVLVITRASSRPISAFQFIVHLFQLVLFVYTELVLRPTTIRYLGMVMAIGVPCAFLLRVLRRIRQKSGAAHAGLHSGPAKTPS